MNFTLQKELGLSNLIFSSVFFCSCRNRIMSISLSALVIFILKDLSPYFFLLRKIQLSFIMASKWLHKKSLNHKIFLIIFKQEESLRTSVTAQTWWKRSVMDTRIMSWEDSWLNIILGFSLLTLFCLRWV